METRFGKSPTIPQAPSSNRKTLKRRRPMEPDLKSQLQGYADFRRCFPVFICFPEVIPTDEDVCLKMFHREDEPLIQFFLDAEQQRRLDHLWVELRFVSQQPLLENKHLPQFIEYATQDRTKEIVAYFNGLREPFRKRAEAFERSWKPRSRSRWIRCSNSLRGPTAGRCRIRKKPTCATCTNRFARSRRRTTRHSAVC